MQILDGTPPANSPPVRVVRVPGGDTEYPGGGYEIVQALVEAASRQGFAAAAQRLALGPVGMAEHFFGQPGPRREQMATGRSPAGPSCRTEVRRARPGLRKVQAIGRCSE